MNEPRGPVLTPSRLKTREELISERYAEKATPEMDWDFLSDIPPPVRGVPLRLVWSVSSGC